MSSESENNSDILDDSRMPDDEIEAHRITEYNHNRLMEKMGMVMLEVGRQFRHLHDVRIRYSFERVPSEIHIVIGNLLTEEGEIVS